MQEWIILYLHIACEGLTSLDERGFLPVTDEESRRDEDEGVTEDVEEKAAQPVFLHRLQHGS